MNKKINFDANNQIIIDRENLNNVDIDSKDRTLIIGYNEPKFKKAYQIKE